jgi:hypothetical protein
MVAQWRIDEFLGGGVQPGQERRALGREQCFVEGIGVDQRCRLEYQLGQRLNRTSGMGQSIDHLCERSVHVAEQQFKD